MPAFIFIVVGVAAGITFCMIHISRRTARFAFVQKLSGGRQRPAVWISFAFYLAVTVVLALLMNVVNAVICLIHFGGFWLLSELVFYIPGRITHKKVKDFLPGTCAIVFSICYMTVAWYLCTHVWEKDYSLDSSQLKGDLRIVQFADSHIGSTFQIGRAHV